MSPRRDYQNKLDLGDELFIDNFAGGGGASTGAEWALGRPVDIAINHSPQALAVHKANHPHTVHLCGDVWEQDPRVVTKGRPVGGAWFSPDCKHFSKAKGGRPVEKNIRGLAWVAVRYAATVRPRVIYLENVEEFLTWGPLDDRNLPCKKRKGQTFLKWKQELEKLGYEVQWRILRACDYGAPTSRKRLFVIARCDGSPIVWPEPTHGPGLTPFRTAADCIDWSIPCPSIFERKRPLAEKTLERIAKGIQKFVIDDPDPFIAKNSAPIITRLGQTKWSENPAKRVDEPITTVVSKQEHLVAAPHLISVPSIIKHFGGVTGVRADKSYPTITARGTQNQLLISHLLTLRNNMYGQDLREPIPTISAGGHHHAEVRSLLIKYYGARSGQYQRPDEPIHTIPTKTRYALVTVHGIDYIIVDIGMRMLTPRELFRAQGFPESYIIDPDFEGKPLIKTAQTMCCGNSVPPHLSHALVKANSTQNSISKVA
jgi:DNA (cytosine-5)-methyltransferase 1